MRFIVDYICLMAKGVESRHATYGDFFTILSKGKWSMVVVGGNKGNGKNGITRRDEKEDWKMGR